MDTIDQIVELYSSGLSLRAIGDRVGRSQQYAYRRLKKAGIRLRPLRGRGPDHSQWKGGRLPAGQGYFRVWVSADDPMASMRNHQGYVLEHRLVLARKLKRPLRRDETVHHVDGDRANNGEGNLQLRQGKHGRGVALCCRDCGSRNIVPAGIEKE